MSLQESRATGRLRLRHLMETTEAVAEEMAEQRGRFERLADPENKPRAVSAFNLFQTPEPVAAMMAERLGSLDGCRVLEPSAGLGRLYQAIRGRSGCPAVLVETAPQCCSELFRVTAGDESATLIQDDFLSCNAARLGGLFDCVVMNPPFKQGRDVKHIRHAFNMLKPSGLLVSLCFDGVKQNRDLKPMADTWKLLPTDTFKSEGTRARVAMLTIRK